MLIGELHDPFGILRKLWADRCVGRGHSSIPRTGLIAPIFTSFSYDGMDSIIFKGKLNFFVRGEINIYVVISKDDESTLRINVEIGFEGVTDSVADVYQTLRDELKTRES